MHRRITVAEHLNITHTVFGDGAAPHNFPCLLLHGFAGLVVVDATVTSMCCFPDKEFHMSNPLGVYLTSMAVLGQHMGWLMTSPVSTSMHTRNPDLYVNPCFYHLMSKLTDMPMSGYCGPPFRASHNSGYVSE